MRAPLSWLRDYAPLDAGVAELADALSEPRPRRRRRRATIGGGLDDVVVARVLDIRPHPDAERIRLVDVDAGDGETLRSCAAPGTSRSATWCPLAPVGAVLPGGLRRSPGARCGASGPTACSAAPASWSCPRRPARDGLLILPPGLAAPGAPLVDALDLQPGRGLRPRHQPPTGPTPCAWPAWPGTWPPPWANPGEPRYEARVRAAVDAASGPRRWSPSRPATCAPGSPPPSWKGCPTARPRPGWPAG